MPGRSNVGFTGQVGDIWWVFILLGLSCYSYATTSAWVRLPVVLLGAYLSWMTIRWIVGNISSNGVKLPIAFKGSPWPFIGWYVLLTMSFVTIIGWAWVTTAWMRWNCRNISGTREITFNASGWDVLWRTLLFAIGCAFLVPIPWVLRWYARWYVSQFALVEGDASAIA